MGRYRKTRGPFGWMAARSRRFWVVAALAPALYVASFGPACWAVERYRLDATIANLFYSLLLMVHESGPQPARLAIELYGRQWSEHGFERVVAGPFFIEDFQNT